MFFRPTYKIERFNAGGEMIDWEFYGGTNKIDYHIMLAIAQLDKKADSVKTYTYNENQEEVFLKEHKFR